MVDPEDIAMSERTADAIAPAEAPRSALISRDTAGIADGEIPVMDTGNVELDSPEAMESETDAEGGAPEVMVEPDASLTIATEGDTAAVETSSEEDRSFPSESDETIVVVASERRSEGVFRAMKEKAELVGELLALVTGLEIVFSPLC